MGWGQGWEERRKESSSDLEATLCNPAFSHSLRELFLRAHCAPARFWESSRGLRYLEVEEGGMHAGVATSGQWGRRRSHRWSEGPELLRPSWDLIWGSGDPLGCQRGSRVMNTGVSAPTRKDERCWTWGEGGHQCPKMVSLPLL